MRIIFTSKAKSDLTDIIQYISKDEPQAARQLADSFFNKIQNLEQFPLLGRVVPEYSNESKREIIHGRYRIVYTIDLTKKEIHIITFHYFSQLLC